MNPIGAVLAAVNRIHRLPEHVANQIAAGEVVERPASVVKELVENALDAGATRIVVDVEEGGASLVRVTDDGSGMSAADAVTCLERHATSKLKQLDDLETLQTLGFRGEALPSIASVSRFVLTTTPRGAIGGTRVTVEGGASPRVEAIGAPPGTTIEVRDLFYNVPARRKFLKRAPTEMSHVSETLVRIALAKPDVALRFTSQGRVVLDVPRATEADPRGRLGRILGAEVAEHLHPLPSSEELRPNAVSVRGWIGAPSLSERTARALYTFVNGRFVRDRTIQHAAQEGYRTLLERGRYPVVVLWLELDPRRVDVNVHPQKTEVRFADTSEVHRAVTAAISRALSAQPWVGLGAGDAVEDVSAGEVLRLARAATPARGGGARAWQEPAPSFWPALTADRPSRGPRERRSEPELRGAAIEPAGLRGVPRLPPLPAAAPGVTASGKAIRFSALEPVGQVLATYLVCQGAGRVVMIDQHAAHERIAFERMRKQHQLGRVDVQPLLVPRTLELDPARAAIASENGAELARLGFELEPFGGATWILKAVPSALGAVDIERIVLDVLDELSELGRGEAPVAQAIDAVLSCAACHTVVRAGDRLVKEEIKALLEQMDEIDFGAHCPHGRPVYVEWTERELAALFHRT